MHGSLPQTVLRQSVPLWKIRSRSGTTWASCITTTVYHWRDRGSPVKTMTLYSYRMYTISSSLNSILWMARHLANWVAPLPGLCFHLTNYNIRKFSLLDKANTMRKQGIDNLQSRREKETQIFLTLITAIYFPEYKPQIILWKFWLSIKTEKKL